jgi:hypothetical protein
LVIKSKSKIIPTIILFSFLTSGCASSKTSKSINDPTTAPISSTTEETTVKPSETTNAPSSPPETTSEAQTKDSTFIFPDSHISKLDEAAIKSVKPEILPFARNEIYARRGYVFTKDAYKNYFSGKSWYIPNPNFNTNDLSDIEKYNANLIKSYENQPNDTQQGTTSIISIYKADVAVSIDLNGDGTKEKVVYKPNKSQLTVNNGSISFIFDSPVEKFAIVDIDVKDNLKEIVISDYGPSDDYISFYYYFDGSKIVKMGETQGLFNSGIKFNGAGKITAETRGAILQTWFFDKSFKLSSNHKIVKIPQALYTTNHDITFKMPLSLYKNKGDSSPSISVKSGQKAKIIATDDKAWCLIKTSSGIKGWIEVDSFNVIRNNGLQAGEVFDGLCFAD